MSTLHKKEKLCGNRQKIFFSKVSGGCKRKTFMDKSVRKITKYGMPDKEGDKALTDFRWNIIRQSFP